MVSLEKSRADKTICLALPTLKHNFAPAVNYLASATATATATVAPTIGLFPIPISPIISTWAGTDEEPANWASLCMRPMVSVIPYEAGPAAMLSGCNVRPVPPPEATEKYFLPFSVAHFL